MLETDSVITNNKWSHFECNSAHCNSYQMHQPHEIIPKWRRESNLPSNLPKAELSLNLHSRMSNDLCRCSQKKRIPYLDWWWRKWHLFVLRHATIEVSTTNILFWIDFGEVCVAQMPHQAMKPLRFWGFPLQCCSERLQGAFYGEVLRCFNDYFYRWQFFSYCHLIAPCCHLPRNWIKVLIASVHGLSSSQSVETRICL